MATLATPGTPSKRALMVQYAIMDRSIRDTSFDDTPIFITRPVDETGGMITGGAAHVGNAVRTVTSRSWTSCRARTTSVPGLNRSSIDDRSGIDLERLS